MRTVDGLLEVVKEMKKAKSDDSHAKAYARPQRLNEEQRAHKKTKQEAYALLCEGRRIFQEVKGDKSELWKLYYSFYYGELQTNMESTHREKAKATQPKYKGVCAHSQPTLRS